MPDNMWFACLPPSLAVTRTALEQSGARGGGSPAPFFGTCALPLLERRGAGTCRGLGVKHGPSEGGPAQWAAAHARAATEQTGSLVAGASSPRKPGLPPYPARPADSTGEPGPVRRLFCGGKGLRTAGDGGAAWLPERGNPVHEGAPLPSPSFLMLPSGHRPPGWITHPSIWKDPKEVSTPAMG
jgi:hypothetical protein